MLYIAAYVFPAALVWGVISMVFHLLSSIPLLLSLLACAYALWFGALEALGLPSQAPSLAWQVPAGWITGRPATVQALIWGTALGPGLVTRNPYAAMWLLPLLLALNSNLLSAFLTGIAVGIAHGGARVLGVLNNRKHMDADPVYVHLKILGAQLRWQYLDGLALLLAGGALVAYAISLLGIHF